VRRVIQKTKIECGVACVAMLANVSYKKAREALFGDGEVDRTWPIDMRRALVALGLNPAKRLTPLRATLFKDRIRRIESLDNNALVWTNETKKESHWVVWDARRKKILDPLEPPYKRLRPKSYLTVE
jgi:ABC-type bacteriocin/lantibiotic exporter with double-glycine peptidase domain